MKNIILTLLFISPLSLGFLQAQESTPFYYWDNQEGLQEAQNCHVTPLRETRFRFSTYYGEDTSQTENLRNYIGFKQARLVNGSLVKLIDGRNKKNYEKVQIIGTNSGLEIEKTRWSAKRLDQGYLYMRSLEPLEDYVVELSPDSAPLIDEQNNIKADYLKVHGKTEYQQLNCTELDNSREYVVFHAYSKKDKSGPIAKIGVYWDETDIFSHIVTHKKVDAFSLIPTLVDDENLAASEAENNQFLNDTYQEQEQEINDEDVYKTNLYDEIQKMKPAESKANKDQEQVKTQAGMDSIVCVSSNTLNVRESNLEQVIFRARKGEEVKVFQGWGENSKQTHIGGVDYNFIKVQFSSREEADQTEGWVAEDFIKPKSECKYIKALNVDRIIDTQITDLDDPNCCEFPTVKKATHPYTSGMRRFKAGRGGGSRWHAAADLYRYKDEPILSVAPGLVIRERYYFYQGTFALEVVHSGGFIVRYGEITGQGPSEVNKGSQLKMGQQIGYMGVVNSGCCRPMLHFELYEGTKTGSLSQSGNKFQRRSDLMDPTPYLLRWENEKF